MMFEISDNPEYIFYGPFGYEHLKYDGIRIFTTGFDYLEFADRHLRLPLCSIMYRNGVNMLDLAIQRGKNILELKEKDFALIPSQMATQ